MEYTQEGLIKYICEKVEGIGAKTADRIAGFMKDILTFYGNTNPFDHKIGVIPN